MYLKDKPKSMNEYVFDENGFWKQIFLWRVARGLSLDTSYTLHIEKKAQGIGENNSRKGHGPPWWTLSIICYGCVRHFKRVSWLIYMAARQKGQLCFVLRSVEFDNRVSNNHWKFFYTPFKIGPNGKTKMDKLIHFIKAKKWLVSVKIVVLDHQMPLDMV